MSEVKSLAQKGVDDAAAAKTEGSKRGDMAWLLTASALVLLMTPGLALFYGGMVRRKNILATMMHSYGAMAVVGVYWLAFGYGLAFGPSKIKVDMFGVVDGGVIGWDWKLFFLKGISPSDYLPGYNITVLTHVMFQGMFAIITPALISGAIAERIRFWPWTIFMILWITLVYCPLAHMVWAFDWFAAVPEDYAKGLGGSAIGLLGKLGALDFAGGTVVHIAAGFGGLACLIALRKRYGYPEHAMHPNSMVITLLGAGLLWFGWFGFNGGSALNASDLAGTGFATTQAAAAAAGLSWIIVEWIFKGKPTALGLASGIVAGLVAVTPASGYVYIWGGAAIGAIAGVVCYMSVQVKSMLGYDDSLDAFGVHGVGGFLGAVLTGVFSYAAVQSASADGFFAVAGYSAHATPEALKAADADIKKQTDAIPKLYDPVSKKNGEIEPVQKSVDDMAAKKKASEDATAAADKIEDALIDDPADKKLITDLADAKKAAEAADKDYEAVKTKLEEDTASLDKLKKELAPMAYTHAEARKALAAAKADKKTAEDKVAGYKKETLSDKPYERTSMKQVGIQIKASLFSAVFAFVISLVLAFGVQAMTLGNFTTNKEDEEIGLDRTEHGEVGFDYGGIDTYATGSVTAPKSAKVPPGGKRFEVVVEGIENGGLMHAWSDLCQPKDGPIDPDFKTVYPYVTTVQGNRFRLRGGDPKTLSASIQRLFQKKLGKPLKVRVEE